MRILLTIVLAWVSIAGAQPVPSTNYVGSAFVRSFDTLLDLRRSTPARSSYVAIIKGLLSVTNRDGFALFFDPVATNTVDNTTVFAPVVGSGRWFKLLGLGGGTTIITNTYTTNTYVTNITTSGLALNFQVFTNPGTATWTNPPGSIISYVMAVGGGGGGEGGCVADIDNAGTYASMISGHGGAGAAWSERFMFASELPASVNVTVGAGTAGGAGSMTPSVCGGTPDAAQPSYFGTNTTNNFIFAGGATGYFDGIGIGQFIGGQGTLGSSDYGQTISDVVSTNRQCTGGGGGGALWNSLIPNDGEGGGVNYAPAYGPGYLPRTSPQVNGIDGISFGLFGTGTGGTGGGGSNIDFAIAADAGNGGNGGYPGGGGGGGGLGSADTAHGLMGKGGNGGNGGNGFVGVVTLYIQ